MDRRIGDTHCGTLLFVDVPVHSAIGIDQYVYTVNDSFKGIKHVPYGTHVVSYAAYGAAENQYGPVTAMFVQVPRVERRDDDQCAGMAHDTAWMIDSAFHGPVIGWKWDKKEEILVGMDDEEKGRAEGMVRSLRWDNELGSYMALHPHIDRRRTLDDISWNSYEEWLGLSGYIDSAVVNKLAPIQGNISIIAEGDPCALLGQTNRKTHAEIILDEQLQNAMPEVMKTCNHAGRCRFTSLPGFYIKDRTLSPCELTSWNMDKSKALESLLKEKYGNNESLFLGEIQFAFLAFLLGHSLEAFLQWKCMLALLLGCDEAVAVSRIELFVNALRVILNQFAFIFARPSGGENFSEISRDDVGVQLIEDSFLKTICTTFIRSIRYEPSCAIDTRIQSIVRDLDKMLSTFLSWDSGPVQEFDDEDGPVVVDM